MKTIRFHLREPWPDFMTFYGTTATAAGIVVPGQRLVKENATGPERRRGAIHLPAEGQATLRQGTATIRSSEVDTARLG